MRPLSIIVERAGLQGGYRILGAAIGRDHRHRQVGGGGADVAHQLQTLAVAEAHVREAQAAPIRHNRILTNGVIVIVLLVFVIVGGLEIATLFTT